MQLFYFQGLTPSTPTFSFDREESKHIVKVLRKKENDTLFVTDGKGTLYTVRITFASENKCSVEIVSSEKSEEPKYKLHIAIAPTKNNERFEWFLEKATEIGIHSITPIICEHSERKNIRPDRLEKILLSAMKQSNTLYLPELKEQMSFAQFVRSDLSGQRFIAHCEETGKQTLKQRLLTGTDVTILIGPEGDFSRKEIQLAVDNQFLPVSLGQTRLRTETAALVACHTVVLLNE